MDPYWLKYLKEIWHDSVWSKIIATAILSAAAGAWALLRDLRRRGRVLSPAKISLVRAWPTMGASTLAYPLKYQVEMINDSETPVKIRLKGYKPNAVTEKKFVPDALQIWFKDWHPKPDGAEIIAVLPQQRFKAWVGIDDRKYTFAQVEGLKDRIGTLIVVVNSTPIEINF